MNYHAEQNISRGNGEGIERTKEMNYQISYIEVCEEVTPESLQYIGEARNDLANNIFYVKEEGCYMSDYEIDGEGSIVETKIQLVIDPWVKRI